MTTPFVSVVVPTLGCGEGLRTCLDSLSGQSFDEDFYEVLVIDNGPVPEAEGELAGSHGWARFFHEPVKGSYRARNLGIRESRGSICAFTDSDCIPDRNWLERGTAAFASGGGCGLLGGRIEVFAGSSSRPRPSPVEQYEMLDAFRQRRFVEKKKFSATANMFTSHDVIDAVGLFNPVLQSGGDVDWGRRVHRSGYSLLYDEDVVVRHPARPTLAARRERDIRVAGGIFEREHRESYGAGRFLLEIFKDLVQEPRRIGRLVRGGGSAGRSARLVAIDLYVRWVQAAEMVRRRVSFPAGGGECADRP